jgi:hypothetical protein
MAARDLDMNASGQRMPGYMTHAELVTELETATGERRDELASEAENRMKTSSSYPRFPASLGLRHPE